MASPEVTIRVLSATPIVDKTIPAEPKDQVLVAYILSDGRMGSFRMDPFGDNLGDRDKAVKADAAAKFGIPADTAVFSAI